MAIVILALIIAALLALYIIMWRTARKTADTLSAENTRLSSENASLAADKAALVADKAALQAAADAAELRLADQREAADRRLADAERTFAERLAHERAMLDEHFKALAADVLANSAKAIDERSKASIEAVISPMKASLDEFAKGYRECYSVENRDRLSLREEIRSLHEMSQRVGDDARRLTTALRGNNRMQGRWGEMVLANILENSGLEPGRCLEYQYTETAGDDRLRPDAIIHCPDDRDIIIDAKVSLKDYLLMLEADTDEEYQQHLNAHLQAVENQMTGLARKEYQKKVGVREGSFVLMFMPHEGAYMAAMNADPELWNRAYDRHVIIVSPTHLVTVIRLVEQLWRGEDLRGNISKIAKKGATMLGLIASYLESIDDIGKKLDDAREKVDFARRQLKTGRSNMVDVAGELMRHGVKIDRKKGVIPDSFADYEKSAHASTDADAAGASAVEALLDQ